MLIATSCNEVIKLHHWPSCEHAKTFTLPYSGYGVTSISWCIDCELIAYTTSSKTPPVIFSAKEADDEEISHEVQFPYVSAVAFSTTRRTTLALGAESGNVMLYDIDSHKITRSLPVLPCCIQFLQYGGKDAILAAACSNGLICVYNPDYNVKATFYMPETDRPISAMVCHSGTESILAGATVDGIIAIWDTNNGNCLYKDKIHIGAVTGLDFSLHTDIVSVGADCSFKCFDIRRQGQIFSVKADCKLTGVEFMSSDGDYIAVTTIDGKIYCYDRRHVAHPVNTIIAHHPKPITKVAFQPFEVDAVTTSSIDLSFTPASTRLNTDELGLQHFYSKNLHNAPYAIVGNDCLYKPPDDELDEVSETPSYFAKTALPQGGFVRSPGSSVSDISKIIPELEPSCHSTKPQVINLQKRDVLAAVTNELKLFTDDITNKLMEYVDEEFLRIRLVVGKGFVDLESQIHSRWDGFTSHFVKFAGGDGGTEIGTVSEVHIEDRESSLNERASSKLADNIRSERRFKENYE